MQTLLSPKLLNQLTFALDDSVLPCVESVVPGQADLWQLALDCPDFRLRYGF